MNKNTKIIIGIVALVVVIFLVYQFRGGDDALNLNSISSESEDIDDLDKSLEEFFGAESALDELDSSLGEGVTFQGSNPLDLAGIEDESKEVGFDSSFDEFFNVESGLDELDL